MPGASITALPRVPGLAHHLFKMNPTPAISGAKPDLVFILCDQLRADFLSLYGCHAIPTPHIDRLASEGIIFDNAISPYPLCVPARAAMLSGFNPIQSGVISNYHWLRPDRAELGLRTWPDLLRDQGYRTIAVGKMHFYPFEASEGFDERIIAEDKRWPLIGDDYTEFLKARGLKKFNAIHAPGYVEHKGAVTFPHGVENTPDRFVAECAAAWIRRQPSDRPIAMMIGFPGPHCPYDPSPEYLGAVTASKLPRLLPRVDDGSPARDSLHQTFLTGHRESWHALDYSDFPESAKLRIRHHYAALVAQIDEEVGRIIAALQASGRFENSLIVFTSDHGDHVGDHDRVGKGTFYEPSVHIPLVVRLPGAIRSGQRITTPVELQSVPATLLTAGGVSPPGWWHYRTLPLGNESTSTNASQAGANPVFGYLDTGTMVRLGPWKLSHYTAGFSELFNLEEDPREASNRINDASCASIRMELDAALREWIHASIIVANKAQLLPDNPPLITSREFSRVGWRRRWPAPFV